MSSERMFNSLAGIPSPLRLNHFPFKLSSGGLRFGPKIDIQQMESPTTYWEEAVDLKEEGKKKKKTNQSSETRRNSSWPRKEMSCELRDVSHVRKCDALLFSREQSGSWPGLLPPAVKSERKHVKQLQRASTARSCSRFSSISRATTKMEEIPRPPLVKIKQEWLVNKSTETFQWEYAFYSVAVFYPSVHNKHRNTIFVLKDQWEGRRQMTTSPVRMDTSACSWHPACVYPPCDGCLSPPP